MDATAHAQAEAKVRDKAEARAHRDASRRNKRSRAPSSWLMEELMLDELEQRHSLLSSLSLHQSSRTNLQAVTDFNELVLTGYFVK